MVIFLTFFYFWIYIQRLSRIEHAIRNNGWVITLTLTRFRVSLLRDVLV